VIVFDPDGYGGNPEIAYLTGHTTSAGTATILRGQEGSTARAHLQDTPWVHSATTYDFGYEPWTVDVDMFMTPVSKIAANWSIAQNSGMFYGGIADTFPATINDELNWDIILSAGIWTIEALYFSNPANGIITFQLDGVTAGTLDTYSAGNVSNVRGSVTGITVATGGKKRLKALMATKNASSSSYRFEMQHIQLRRTT
jgi:hypothetical protein